MKGSEVEKPKESDKRSEGFVLSKNNLLELIEGKKMKTARIYIEELKNQNPKAQKYIKQVLDEIFCKKKVSSASVYTYALVFYKNLLVSGQLDYYEDNQFFPMQIHDAVARICEYNQKQPHVKSKGTEYFKNCVKIQPNQKLKQDLQTMGVAVVIYAMELLQSMAEWYKDDYFTGDESHFFKKYTEYTRRGIMFPRKQDFIYIKKQDKIEFEKNYLQLLQNAQQEPKNNQQQKLSKPIDSALKPQKQNLANSKPKSSQILFIQSNSINESAPKQRLIKNTQRSEKLNLTEPKNQLLKDQVKIPNESIKSKETLFSRVQQQKVQKENQVKKQIQTFKQSARKNESQISSGKKIEIQPQKIIQKEKSTLNNNSTVNLPTNLLQESRKSNLLQLGPKQLSSQNNKSVQSNSTKEKFQSQVNHFQKVNLTKSKVVPYSTQKSHQKNISINIPPQVNQKSSTSPQKRDISPNLLNPTSSSKKALKRTQQAGDKGTSQKPMFSNKKSQNSFLQQTHSKHFSRDQITAKRKHKIFQTAPKLIHPSDQIEITQKPQTNNNEKLNSNQLPIGMKINILSSNLSFSPNVQTQKKVDSIKESSIIKKRSVPKTQKQLFDRTFTENEELAFKLGLTPNFQKFSQNKKSSQKFPMKTLSAWRCQRQIKRDFSPENKINHQTLTDMLKKLKFKEMVLPFVPEYFEPITLKMFGLRKSALEIAGFAQTSQVFFNNKVIQARLMKPSRNSYVLSLLNVSRLPLKISLSDMKKIAYSNKIKFLGNGASNQTVTTLNSGCYMDINFTFQTQDLNFKFLTFELLIDSRVLSLQLPITLLDQCNVENKIQADDIFSYTKKFGKIITSEPFKINIKNLPIFIRKKSQSSGKQKQTTYRKIEEEFLGFTLKIKLEESQYISSLSCCLCPCNNIQDTHRLQIIFDSISQETEAFAKVIVQLLTFLLWQ